MKVKGIAWLGSPIEQIFGPRAIGEGHEFMRAPVAGFALDDVDKGRTHFFAPDGHVYELTSTA